MGDSLDTGVLDGHDLLNLARSVVQVAISELLNGLPETATVERLLREAIDGLYALSRDAAPKAQRLEAYLDVQRALCHYRMGIGREVAWATATALGTVLGEEDVVSRTLALRSDDEV